MQALTLMCLLASVVNIFGVMLLIGTFRHTLPIESQDEDPTGCEEERPNEEERSDEEDQSTMAQPTTIKPTTITATQLIVVRAGSILLICGALAFSYLQYLDVRGNLNAYVYLGSIVSEEYQLLTDAKSGPLDDAPSVIDIQNAFIADVTRLNELQKLIEWAPEDFICQQVFPELLQEYNKVPDFSLQLQAYAEDYKRLE